MQYRSKYDLAQSTIDNIHLIYRNDWGHVDANLLLDVLERRGKDYVRTMLSPNTSWKTEQIENLKDKWILDTQGNLHQVINVFTISSNYGNKAIQLDSNPQVIYAFSNNNRCQGLIILDVFDTNPLRDELLIGNLNAEALQATMRSTSTPETMAASYGSNELQPKAATTEPYQTLGSQLSTFDNDDDEDGNEN